VPAGQVGELSPVETCVPAEIPESMTKGLAGLVKRACHNARLYAETYSLSTYLSCGIAVCHTRSRTSRQRATMIGSVVAAPPTNWPSGSNKVKATRSSSNSQ
jgi:hypothetical protein